MISTKWPDPTKHSLCQRAMIGDDRRGATATLHVRYPSVWPPGIWSALLPRRIQQISHHRFSYTVNNRKFHLLEGATHYVSNTSMSKRIIEKKKLFYFSHWQKYENINARSVQCKPTVISVDLFSIAHFDNAHVLRVCVCVCVMLFKYKVLIASFPKTSRKQME